jgi:hypothetical protein
MNLLNPSAERSTLALSLERGTAVREVCVMTVVRKGFSDGR